MSNSRKIRIFDVTSRKSNKIEFLIRQVNDAKTVVSKAEAKYQSFVEKANTFAVLYAEAAAELGTTEIYWRQFLQVQSDLNGLHKTGGEANLIAVDAFYNVQKLIKDWEDVVAQTLKAAEAIILTAEYIEKRKASNKLISADLVNDAIEAARKAEMVVAIVIKAFSAALNTLSSSAQVNNSTELTNVYISQAISTLLKREVDTASPLSNTLLPPQTRIFESLETSLEKSLADAQNKIKICLAATEAATREMNTAKEELDQAVVAMDTWEAALSAAEAAVAG